MMTKAPHWKYQNTEGKIYLMLQNWSLKTGLGRAIINPGVIFNDADNVIPDVVWISNEKLAISVDKSGHLTTSPELIVEVLSEKINDIRRDKEIKLKLYFNRGVEEYWSADWRLQQVEVYRRNQSQLALVETLFFDDEITSPLLLNFACVISQFFS
jgi:Uma2 family endonuclease